MNTLAPGRYRVTVNFDNGTDQRTVITNTEREPYYILHQAIADMRMASPYGGPGVNGEVHDWRVDLDE